MVLSSLRLRHRRRTRRHGSGRDGTEGAVARRWPSALRARRTRGRAARSSSSVDVELGHEPLERSAPEHAADDRRVLQDALRARRQAGRCAPRSAPGRCRGSGLGAVALEQHPRGLLEEQRIAFRPLEHERALARCGVRRREQLVGELRGSRRRTSGASSIALRAGCRRPSRAVLRAAPRARRTTIRRGDVRERAREMLDQRRAARSSAHWTSSNTSTSGCASASCSAQRSAAQLDLLADARSPLGRAEHAERDRRADRPPPRSRSRRAASRTLRRPDRRR